MITYFSTDGKVALQISAQESTMVFGVFESWEQFCAGAFPTTTHTINGLNNYAAVEALFSGWSKICRDDSTWAIVACGPTPQPTVPANVSARQIRLWLISNNISLAQIDTLINAIEDPMQREYAKVEWEFAPYIERNHPLVATFASALGLTEEQIDAGFITASTL